MIYFILPAVGTLKLVLIFFTLVPFKRIGLVMKSKMEELFSKQVKNMQVLSIRYSVFLGFAGSSSNG